MSNPPLSDIDFKNKMDSVWTTLNPKNKIDTTNIRLWRPLQRLLLGLLKDWLSKRISRNLRCIVVIKLVRQVHSVSKWFSLHVYKILSVFWLQKNSALLSGITGRPYSSLLGRTVLARTTSHGRGSPFPWWIEHHCMMNELTWAFVNEFFRIFRSQRVRVKNSGIEIILCCNWSAYFSRASNDSGSLFSVQIMAILVF